MQRNDWYWIESFLLDHNTWNHLICANKWALAHLEMMLPPNYIGFGIK